MFDVQRFQILRKGNFGSELRYYEEIESTNPVALELARNRATEGTVVLADRQLQGRGRNSHGWFSPGGVNLYFTMILYPDTDRLHYLPFLVALSIARTLEQFGVSCDLKWPNDVLVQGKKISGILIQTSMEENRLQFALVGVGINLNIKAFPSDLEPIATSVLQVTGKDVDREEFFASQLLALEQLYKRSREMTWEELSAAFKSKSSFVEGCEVRITQDGKVTMGTTAGLDPMGGLILKTTTGQEVFYAGEVQSCRKN